MNNNIKDILKEHLSGNKRKREYSYDDFNIQKSSKKRKLDDILLSLEKNYEQEIEKINMISNDQKLKFENVLILMDDNKLQEALEATEQFWKNDDIDKKYIAFLYAEYLYRQKHIKEETSKLSQKMYGHSIHFCDDCDDDISFYYDGKYNNMKSVAFQNIAYLKMDIEKDFDGALSYLQNALNIEKSHIERKNIEFNMGVCNIECGKFDSALINFRKNKLWRRKVDHLYAIGRCCKGLGNNRMALKHFNNALNIDSNFNSSCFLDRAQVYEKLGNTKKALEDYFVFSSTRNVDDHTMKSVRKKIKMLRKIK